MATFGKDAFTEGLKQLGYTPEDRGGNRLAFSYTIKLGRFAGQVITVGIEVPPDFNVTCPTGPHISPRIIPQNPGGGGNDRAADSPFDEAGKTEWQYLSRPFVEGTAGWNRTTRDVKAYVRWVKRILETL